MNFDFLKMPREKLEKAMLNGVVRIMNREQYKIFKEMLSSLSNEEFYSFAVKSAMECSKKMGDPTLRDFLNLEQKAYLQSGTNPGNTALNSERPYALTPKEVEEIQEKVSASRPDDVIRLTYEEDDEIMGLWKYGKNSQAISVPSDIFFANTVPLKDCRIVVDERGLSGGQVVEFRVVIFDYKEDMERADFNTPIPIGCVLMPIKTGNLIFPFLVVRGVDFILSGSIGFSGLPAWYEKQYCEKASVQDILNTLGSFLSTWYGIQIALLHPTVKKVFRHPRIQAEEKKGSHRHPQKRKVRYVKTHVINKDELVNAIYGEQHSINRRALVWYVIGHWRTYASGKKVFIQPYWKGALREMKSAAELREREIVTGGITYA